MPDPGPEKTVVDQPDHAPVLRGADHPSCCLGNLLQSRNQPGVFVAGPKALLQTLPEDFMPGIERRQSQGGHKGTNQLFPRQIYTFTEHPTQHRKSHAPGRLPEARQKIFPLRWCHGRMLRPPGHIRGQFGQGPGDLIQIPEATEEGQIMAGTTAVLIRNQCRQWALLKPPGPPAGY